MNIDLKIPENIETYKFENGITLIMESLPNYSTSSISLFLKTGSRDESLENSGFSHFIEHMLFKGTSSETKLSISEKFDQLGGLVNAYTSKEEIVLYNMVPTIHLEESLKLMIEMFNESEFNENEVNLEKDVILNELSMTLEDPQEKLFEDFFQNLFPNSGLGRPIIGFEKNIDSATAEKLKSFYNNIFTGNNLIISIAGNFISENIKNLISNIQFRTSHKNNDITAIKTIKKNGFTKMQSELIHVVSGNVIYNTEPEFYFRISLLNMIIGSSMSSRLFQKVRDNLGLCYTINSDIDHFREETVFSIYYSVMPSKLEQTTKTVKEIIQELQTNGVTENELSKVKKQKIAQIILSTDQLTKRMNSNIYYNLFYKNNINRNDAIRIINKTTKEDINNLIKSLFNSEYYTHLLYKKRPKDFLWKI